MSAEPLNLAFQSNYHKPLKLFSLWHKCWGQKLRDWKQSLLTCDQPSVCFCLSKLNKYFLVFLNPSGWINLSEVIWIDAFVPIQTEQNRSEQIPACPPRVDLFCSSCVGIFDFHRANASNDGSRRSFPGAVICLRRASAINSSTRSSVKVRNPVKRAAANHLPAGAFLFFFKFHICL